MLPIVIRLMQLQRNLICIYPVATDLSRFRRHCITIMLPRMERHWLILILQDRVILSTRQDSALTLTALMIHLPIQLKESGSMTTVTNMGSASDFLRERTNIQDISMSHGIFATLEQSWLRNCTMAVIGCHWRNTLVLQASIRIK